MAENLEQVSTRLTAATNENQMQKLSSEYDLKREESGFFFYILFRFYF